MPSFMSDVRTMVDSQPQSSGRNVRSLPVRNVPAMTSELSTRPSKVQKTAAAVPTRRARKSLKDLPNMPLDIIIEIFCMLTPRDLLSLYRTTKAFRALLTNPQSVAIWRAARYSMPRVFDCPMDVSEPFWANLMYGESKCGVCGAFANVKRIFVEFRSRLCASCMLRFCFTPPKSKKEPWPYDPAAVNLVPYIMHAPGRSTKPRPHYWKPEIEQVTHTLRCLQANVIRGAPGARRALEDYQYARAAHVRVVLEHAARCREVLEKAAVDCSREALVLVRRERYEQVCSRFIALGYHEADVKSVVRDSTMRAAPLTERSWQIVKNQHTPLLEKYRKTRDQTLTLEAHKARLPIIRAIYEDFLKDKTQLERLTLPCVQHVYNFPKFRALLDFNHAHFLPPAEFEVLKPELPRFVADWCSARDAMLLDLIKRASRQQASISRGPAGVLDVHVTADASVIGLATFVVACRHKCHRARAPLAVGMREVLMHAMHDVLGPSPCLGPSLLDPSRLAYVPCAANAAATLVRLAGLDEQKTSSTHMDSAVARYTCDTCCASSDRDVPHVRSSMNWRQCLQHCLDQHDVSTPPKWRVLSADECAMSCTTEGQSDTEHDRAWGCNHCYGYGQPVYLYRTDVVDHLRTSHAIEDPVDDRDLFAYPACFF